MLPPDPIRPTHPLVALLAAQQDATRVRTAQMRRPDTMSALRTQGEGSVFEMLRAAMGASNLPQEPGLLIRVAQMLGLGGHTMSMIDGPAGAGVGLFSRGAGAAKYVNQGAGIEYVIHRNVRPGEKPWRVTLLDLDNGRAPISHRDYDDIKEAAFAIRRGGEGMPYSNAQAKNVRLVEADPGPAVVRPSGKKKK
jgi:hypothetical protein